MTVFSVRSSVPMFVLCTVGGLARRAGAGRTQRERAAFRYDVNASRAKEAPELESARGMGDKGQAQVTKSSERSTRVDGSGRSPSKSALRFCTSEGKAEREVGEWVTARH
jgi:hypothetical protein